MIDDHGFYRAVDFTVMASRYEPFGLVGVESLLCGTPVLCAQGVGCAEVLRAPAQIPFRLDAADADGDSFAAAVGEGHQLVCLSDRAFGATRAAVAQLTVPVIAIVAGLFFLGETLSLTAGIACAIVLAGVSLAMLPSRR